MGPCVQASFLQRTVHIPDLRLERRWPRFASAAMGLGVRSVLSLRLYAGDEDHLGALNLYGSAPRAFTPDAVTAGTTLATHAAIALTAARRASQFHSALETRDVIGQAKGVVMERYNLDADEAFNLLSRLSNESNIKIAEIARRLVAADRPR